VILFVIPVKNPHFVRQFKSKNLMTDFKAVYCVYN